MSVLVIDASVAAKWVLPPEREAFAEQALDLLNRYSRREVDFVLPDFFWAELGNVLWKAVRLGRCNQAAAEAGLASMRGRGLPTVPTEGILERAFAIATAFNRTVYDSLYVALAIESRAQLITADERLANAIAAHLPVKWLGALA